jgi:hypothetical protein
MSQRASSVLAGLAVALLGIAFASSASADCGADHQSVSLPTTTAQTGPAPMTPVPQGPQAPQTGG